MRVLFYESIVSPHQMPFCDALASNLGEGNFCYCATAAMSEERKKLGWAEVNRPWIIKRECGLSGAEISRFANEFDVLFTWLLDRNLIAGFLGAGKEVAYASERYFKPPYGMLGRLPFAEKRNRMLLASKLLCSSERFFYLPVGIHAARDMARLCGLYNGDLSCLFRAPELGFEKKSGGMVLPIDKLSTDGQRYCLDKMRMWGYYVEPSKFDSLTAQKAGKLKVRGIKVLWVGRLLDWKRVDTIVRAVGELSRASSNYNLQLQLDIYGTGPEEKRLKKLAAKYGDCIKFYPPVPIAEVRTLMKKHDIYVLASNAYEGWGAVVSEALEEGLRIVGTYEAGSSATILPDDCLFHAGDVDGLRERLCQGAARENSDKNLWSASNAADAFMEMCKG